MMAAPITESELVGTDKLLERVSASRLQTFHQCRLKFYFRYVLKLQKPKTPALQVGSSVHAALQAWHRARWNQQRIDLDAIRESFARHWIESQSQDPVRWPDDEPETAAMEEAWNMFRVYLQNTPIPTAERIDGVEVTVETDLSSRGLPTKLMGIIDLVRADHIIVDFKTAGQTPNSEKAIHLHELQLSCYGLLYRDATGRQENGFELHHLVKLKTPKLVVTRTGPMTNHQEQRLLGIIDSYIQGVVRSDWVPNPNPMTCACCEYFNECRRWLGNEIHGGIV